MQRFEMAQEEIEITLRVCLDDIDRAILEIFQRSPSKTYKLHHIKTILDYKGLNINYGKLSRKLSLFSDLALISKTKKSSNVFLYKLLE